MLWTHRCPNVVALSFPAFKLINYLHSGSRLTFIRILQWRNIPTFHQRCHSGYYSVCPPGHRSFCLPLSTRLLLLLSTGRRFVCQCVFPSFRLVSACIYLHPVVCIHSVSDTLFIISLHGLINNNSPLFSNSMSFYQIILLFFQRNYRTASL